MRSEIASTSFSLWEMKTIDRPAGFERLDDLEQIVDLLRGQHGSRLVEDQAVRLAVEGLQDLGPLLDADRQVLDERIGIDLQPVSLREIQEFLARRVPVEQPQSGRGLDAQHDVLEHREHGHQHEVLVDHPDAGCDRVRRDSRSRRACRRSGSVLRPRCRDRTGRSSRSTCRRRSRPDSVWTSPSPRERSTFEFATTPGNRLVIPRSSTFI